MEYGLIDTIYRSRVTLLAMLDTRGYNTEPYKRFSPKEIEVMIGDDQIGNALRMDLTRREGVGPQKCVVIYRFQKQKSKLATLMAEILDDDVPEEYKITPENTEVIVILNEPIVDTFHALAYKEFKLRKLRIRFFEAKRIITDPTTFVIVPKHEKIEEEEARKVMNDLYLKSKKQLPIIRFHEDPQARWLGLLPDEVVKITRPSPMAGEYIVYRVCRP
jgi:DNA-directed RNA polymerase subunit H